MNQNEIKKKQKKTLLSIHSIKYIMSTGKKN